MSSPRRIILDTNFLMVFGLFGVDIVSEVDKACPFLYKLCLLDKTKLELDEIIEKQSGKDKSAAKLAKQLIENKKFAIIDTSDDNDYVDDILVKMAKKDVELTPKIKSIVATNDINLIKRLKEQNVPVLRLRQKKYVVLEE